MAEITINWQVIWVRFPIQWSNTANRKEEIKGDLLVQQQEERHRYPVDVMATSNYLSERLYLHTHTLLFYSFLCVPYEKIKT